MKKFGHMKNKVLKVLAIISSHHTGAYAAQAAYFFMLSLIPIIILLITMVQFTTVSQEEVLETVMQIFPTSVEGMVRSIVMEVYRQSGATISLSVIMVVWSAGKGVLSITSGLNCIYDNTETRNYVFLRLRASLYTVLFIVAIVLSLVLSGFGNSIALLVQKHVPVVAPFIDFIIQIRTHLNLVVLILFGAMVYKYLPNRKDDAKTTMRQQLPGALFSACGWLLLSMVFSIYLDIFKGFSSMYGSMTTIILIMIWLYMCMYVILLGGEMNAILEKYADY
ncbi:MAG: YihY/virulence factor BrkB family protein [Ruminococcus sp.]|nr:YihY/virulence factor BrkB family protein [Ruminococcus sp.]